METTENSVIAEQAFRIIQTEDESNHKKELRTDRVSMKSETSSI